MKKIFKIVMLFFLLNIQVKATLPDYEIEKFSLLLVPVLDKSCELSKVFKMNMTWSKGNFIKLFKKEFNEKEMKEIISFYEEMGGYEYTKKLSLIHSTLIQILYSLNVKDEPVNISPEYDSLIEKEMIKAQVKYILANAYQLQQVDKLKASNYRNTEKFISRAQKYLKLVISQQFTENEYRKEFDFLNSDLGRRLEKIFERIMVVNNEQLVDAAIPQVFEQGAISFKVLKSASSKSDIEKHLHRKLINKVKDPGTGAYEEVIMLTFFGTTGPIIVGFDDNDQIIYTSHPLHKDKITYRKRGDKINSDKETKK